MRNIPEPDTDHIHNTVFQPLTRYDFNDSICHTCSIRSTYNTCNTCNTCNTDGIPLQKRPGYTSL